MMIFSSLNLYQSEYHCYSKCLALICLEALDMQSMLPVSGVSAILVGVGVGVWRVH